MTTWSGAHATWAPGLYSVLPASRRCLTSLHARFRAQWVDSLEMRQIQERRDAEGRSIEETATGGDLRECSWEGEKRRTEVAYDASGIAEFFRDL